MKYELATSSWGKEEDQSAIDVLLSGKCTNGPITKQYEEAFAAKVGTKYAVACNSGSSANLLAISALLYRKNGPKLTQGDTVLITAVSWATSYTVLHQAGLHIKFVDIDLNTLNIDYTKTEAAITPKTTAIFVVNLLGNPSHLSNIKMICEKYNLLMIIDNCESQGATFNNKEAGTFGVIGTYSTFFSHITASVEGGVCVSNDEELVQIMSSLRSHGWLRHLPDKNHICDKTGNPFLDSFKFILPGYNLRSNDIFSAIGIEQLKKLDTFLETRRQNAETFKEEMFNLSQSGFYSKGNIIFQSQEEESNSSHFGFSLILDKGFSGKRDYFIKRLAEMEIETRPIVAGNFATNPVCALMNCSTHGILTNAEKIDKDGFFIGNSHVDLTEEIEYFAECMKTIIKEV